MMKKTMVAVALTGMISTGAFAKNISDLTDDYITDSGQIFDKPDLVWNDDRLVVDLVTEGELAEALKGSTYDDKEIKDQITDLSERIEEVNIEDQRLTDGKVVDGELKLYTEDQDGDSRREVSVDVSGLDQSEEVAALQGQVTKAKKDILVNADNIAGNKVAIGENAQDIEQNTNILQGNNGNTVEQSIYEANLINNNGVVGKLMEQDEYNKKMSELYAAHDEKINSNTSRIGSLEGRMGKVETEIAGIHNDIKRLDGAVAGMAAANAMVLPSNFNGDAALSIGVGHYNGQNGLAVGIVHDGGDYTIKATVSGTDADNWNNLTYGASVNFTTNFFD